MVMQPQRQDDDEQPLAPVIPLFRHSVDLDDDEDVFDDGDDLILRFVDELVDGPGAS